MKKLSSFITRFSSYTGALVFGVLLGISTSAVFAWTAPTEAPPGGNVSGAPLTTGGGQIKTGGLVLNQAGQSEVGLIVGNGGLAVGRATLPTSFAEQGLAVNGKVAAQEYCDKNGENCSSAPLGDDGTDTLANLSCSTNQIAKWNGYRWVCAEDKVEDTNLRIISEKRTLRKYRPPNREYVRRDDNYKGRMYVGCREGWTVSGCVASCTGDEDDMDIYMASNGCKTDFNSRCTGSDPDLTLEAICVKLVR